MPVTCPVCEAENPEGSRFCNGCGSRLPDRVALAEERKVITALFCDLVGFTASSESADPEDVDRMLTRYFAMARRQIEAHGGAVEKFIGDAVVGVFGVPQAHEDDPERAVRAALRICDEAVSLPAIGGTPLRLRIGINTGEALVRLVVTPASGERFLAGDAVNTASRIQSVAPEMGVAVGQATYAATERRFEYEELPPATLKGKPEPVRVFHPIAPRSRQGIEVLVGATTPFVGRADELQRLTELVDATVATGSSRFATVVGVPGLGKSRLVAELLAYVDAAPILVTWRQGRCLPYGTGISFWALGEIVKAHAGILDSDGAEVAVDKLDRMLGETEDRAWLRERLLPLVGIESGPAAGRDEQFAAWRRYLELVAEERPTILVFEDLHWADDAMLTFLEDLATRPAAVPLLVLSTARPELFDRRPAFPGSGSAIRVDLRPLPAEAAEDLALALLDGVELADEVREPILDRAAGNPLFVEEFIRLLRDRDMLVSSDGRLDLREGAAMPVPDSIQALLAARLDALPAEAKAVLTDAAVVGKVFWGGAVVRIGARDPADADSALGLLAAREFIRVAPRSSMADETEYAFWHVLVRDVAYAALPRAARASRHVAVAGWIEERAGDRVEDLADVLAHHYSTALDLARAVGDDAGAAAVEPLALRFLLMAGERAVELDVESALAVLERALALAPAGHPERPAALRRYGQALGASGRSNEAVLAYEEAIEGFRAVDDGAATAEVLGRLSSTWRDLDDARGWTSAWEEVEQLERLGPSWQLTEALCDLAFVLSVSDRLEESLAALERAEAVAAGNPHPSDREALAFRGGMLALRGMNHALLGDEAGLDEIREGLRLSIEAGASNRAGNASANLAEYVNVWHGPREAALDVARGIAFAESRGLKGHVATHQLIDLMLLYDLGEHDRLLAAAPNIAAALASYGWIVAQVDLHSNLVRLSTLRGERTDPERLAWLDKTVRVSNDSNHFMGLAASAPASLLAGNRQKAHDLLMELVPAMTPRTAFYWQPRQLPSLVRAALDLGDIEIAESLVSEPIPCTYAQHAAVAARAAILEARGEVEAAIGAYEDAAARWASFGVVPEEGFALLGWGRALLASGRIGEAATPLDRARAIFGRLKAVPTLSEVDALLVRAASAAER